MATEASAVQEGAAHAALRRFDATLLVIVLFMLPLLTMAKGATISAECAPPAADTTNVRDIRPTPAFAPYEMDVANGKDGISRSIVSAKMWDHTKTALLADELPRLHAQLGHKPVLLDIGANVGWFTLLAAASGHARVIAIEASESNAARLERSLCLNANFKNRVTLHKVGVGASTAECALVARRKNIVSPTAVCGERDPAAFMNRWGSRRGFRDYVVTGSMRMTRIDDLVTSHVDVIKIDVEGHELEVAKGWSDLYDRSPPRLVLTEYVPSLIAVTSNTTEPLDYLRFFLRRGYTIEADEYPPITTEKQLVRWKAKWMNDLVIRRGPGSPKVAREEERSEIFGSARLGTPFRKVPTSERRSGLG